MKTAGQLVQALVGGVLLGAAALSVWALLAHAPQRPDDGLADPKAPPRVFRYQGY
jgi:hypothetical protein